MWERIFWSSLPVPQACVQLKVKVWDLTGCFWMVHLFYAIYWAACVSFPLTVIAFCTLNLMLQALIQCIKVGHLRGKHTFKSKNKINFLTINKHWGTYAYFFVDWATWVLIKVGSNFSRKKGIVCECVCTHVHVCTSACVHLYLKSYMFIMELIIDLKINLKSTFIYESLYKQCRERKNHWYHFVLIFY